MESHGKSYGGLKPSLWTESKECASKVVCQIGKMYLVVSHKVQCSVPTLFVVFINDMPDVITSISKMFVDDAKVFRQIETCVDTATLQNDLNHLTDWSIKWQIEL